MNKQLDTDHSDEDVLQSEFVNAAQAAQHEQRFCCKGHMNKDVRQCAYVNAVSVAPSQEMSCHSENNGRLDHHCYGDSRCGCGAHRPD